MYMKMKLPESQFNVSFEFMTPTLLLASLERKMYGESRVPSYWELYKEMPLMVGIDTNSGRIKKLDLYISKEDIMPLTFPESALLEYDPTFDATIFTKEYDFVEQEGQYFVDLQGNTLYCKFKDCSDDCIGYSNGRVSFYVDIEKRICAFSIKNLNEDEATMIRSLNC